MSGRSAFLGLLVLVTFLPPVIVFAVAGGAMAPIPGLLAMFLLISVSLAHVPATMHLVADPNARSYLASRPGWRIGVPLAMAVALPTTLALVSEAGAVFVLGLFIAYQMWHFGRQNLGVLAFAALAARSAPLSSGERAMVNIATVAGMMSVTNPGVYSVLGFKLDALFGWIPPLRGGFAAAHSIGFVLYLAAIAAFIAVWLWRRSPRSVPETMLQFGALVFFVPVYLSPTPAIAYWSYATAHGLQYLLFLGYHATGWSYGLGRNPARKWPKGVLGLISLVAFAISVVVLLRTQQSLPAPFRAAIGSVSDWFGSPLNARALVRGGLGVTLGITLAHFWLDQNLWRLREPSRRAWVRDRYAFLFAEAPAAVRDPYGAPVPNPSRAVSGS